MSKRTFLFLLSFLLMLPSLQAQLMPHKVRMGVVLPLKEKTSRGAKMVEFYQGLLMAVDSLKHMGCSVEVTALHSGSSAVSMDSLLFHHRTALGDCDVIFGPLDVTQLPAIVDFCDLRGVRLVMPFSSLATQVPGHPLHYLVNAPRHQVQKQATWFAQTLFPEENFVVIESGEKNEEGTSFVERVRMALDGRGIYVKQIHIEDIESEFETILESEKMNVLLLNSSSLAALNALMDKLRSFSTLHSEYRFSLFGYPAWQTYASQMQSDLFRFDTYIYSAFYRDPVDKRVMDFEQRFKNNFGRTMAATYPRYGLFGFDLGYYFLYGLWKYGNMLEANLSAIPVVPLQNAFEFQSEGEGNGYINDFVEIVHYANYQATEILYRNQE